MLDNPSVECLCDMFWAFVACANSSQSHTSESAYSNFKCTVGACKCVQCTIAFWWRYPLYTGPRHSRFISPIGVMDVGFLSFLLD